MRLVFAGTPDFAVPALDALTETHEVVAVFTQPDRPAGRGRRLQETPVGRRALARRIPVLKPARLDDSAQAQLRSLSPDAVVVVAYGLILPPAVLGVPRLGCINIHASLLPRWRGAAPIQRAILAGDRETGISIMRMDAGLDTGPVLLSGKIPIAETDTAGDLHDRLAALGARLVVEALSGIGTGELRAVPQPADGATYAPKVTKDEARLDWSRTAEELARQVRAFNPVPVTWSEIDGERVRIHRASAVRHPPGTPPGTVLTADADGILVATGSGALRIETLQRPGARAVGAADAARGWNLGSKRFA